jgi:uncharacterized protein YciI
MATITMVAASLFLILTSVCVGEDDAPKEKPLYWVFLTTGKSTKDVAAEDIQAMQRAHLENFGRLARAGELITAGPLRDPEQVLRGIVIVHANDTNELEGHFEPDPYVQEGYMRVESFPLEVLVGKIHTQLTPTSLEEFRLVVLKYSEKPAGETPAHDPFDKLPEIDGLRYAGRFTSSEPHCGVMVFSETDDQKVKERVQSLPGVADGKISLQIMPLYVGKGTFDAGDETP